MSVRLRKALDGRARHQERPEHALVHGRDGARLHAFVVVVVPAVEIDAYGLAARGVEDHAEEAGQHIRADALGERLAFAFVLLAVAFDAVAEDLVEEDAGGAPGEDGRADERLGLGGLQQFGDVVGHAVDGRQNHLVVRQPRFLHRLKGLKRAHVGAVGGLGRSVDRHARKPAPVSHARTFGIHQVARVRLAQHGNVRGEHARVVPEAARVLADLLLPLGLGEFQLARDLHEGGRGLGGEIVGIVRLGHLHLGVGLDTDQPLRRRTIRAVGFQPEPPLDGVGVVLEGDEGAGGELPPIATHPVVVVELRGTDADGDVQGAALAPGGGIHRAQRARHRAEFLLRDLVAQEVRRWIGFVSQNPEIAV